MKRLAACVALAALALLLSAATVKVSTHEFANADGSHDTGYKTDSKASTLAWDTTCLDTALSPIASQSISFTTAIPIDTASGCLTGAVAAGAILSFVQAADGTTACAPQWTITGSAPNRTLSDTGPSTGGGSCKLKATYLALTAYSNAYPWAYTGLPTDPLAPPIPTDLTTTNNATSIVISGDTPWDACGASTCRGAQDVQIQKDGSGTLATVTVGAGYSCNPTLTNIGGMATTPTAVQSGNDWTITAAGTLDSTADAAAFNNCAFSGAGFAVMLVNSIGATPANYRKDALVRREAQSTAGSREIYSGFYLADTGGTFFFVDARLTTDAVRQHLAGPTAAALPACVKMQWDANNVHTFSTSPVVSGKCDNNWTVQLSGYSMTFPTTSYVGQIVTSTTGSSGAAVSVNNTQLNINNQARWSYVDTTTGTHTYAARGRDLASNASAYSPTISGTVLGGSSSATKLHPGPYIDCYIQMPHGGDFNHFIGSDGYYAFRACVDWAALQPGVKGVMIPLFWASLEGNTAGTYSGTTGNGLASANKIGFLLVHDMLNYAAAKSMKVILELDWFNYYNDADCTATATDNSPNGAYKIRGLLPGYLLSTACGGTDSGGATYSGAFYTPGSDGTSSTFYLKLWKSAVMTRWIALMNAYAAEFDTDPALEGWIMFGEEGDATILPADGSQDGYTFAALDTQFQRIVSEVKPNWPHTDIIIATTWMRHAQDILAEAATSASKAVGVASNNTIVSRSDYGQVAYLGVPNPPENTNTNTHNYQGEISYTIWLATPWEVCQSPYDRYGYYTISQQYNALMSTGFTSSGGRPLKPSRWILSNYSTAALYCPSEVTNNWGTVNGSGVLNFIQTHPINTTCPSKWTGGCNFN